MTAALHALILFIFSLLISGLGYPGLIVFQQQNIFIIKNKQQERYTSSKQQERHIKNTVLKTLQNILVARGRQSLRTGSNPVPYTQCTQYCTEQEGLIWTQRRRTPTRSRRLRHQQCQRLVSLDLDLAL